MSRPRYWLAGTLTAICLAVAANAQVVTQVVNSVAVGGITGLGTGVATALGIAVGSAGGPVTNGGALGTPSSGVATNLSGTAASLIAGNVTTNANLTGDVTSVGNATTLASTARLKSQRITGTRDLTAATGSVSYTGMGFQPTSCVGSGQVAASATQYTSYNSISDSSRNASTLYLGTTVNYSSAFFFIFTDATITNVHSAVISSYDADGLTLSWVKTASPTGTASFSIMCYR